VIAIAFHLHQYFRQPLLKRLNIRVGNGLGVFIHSLQDSYCSIGVAGIERPDALGLDQPLERISRPFEPLENAQVWAAGGFVPKGSVPQLLMERQVCWSLC